MTLVLSAAGLGKRFADGRGDRQVLADLNLDVRRGEIVALLGPSGSGKTTLLNLAAGLLDADAGQLWLHDENGRHELSALDVRQRARLRRARVGYVFQFFNLVPTLTVRENVLLPLQLNRRPDLVGRALGRLQALGMAPHLDAFPEALSGGERQRTAIARALAHEPLLVLADEPTGNLDADNAVRVVTLLWQEVRALDSALLVATHDERIASQADRILRFGR